jgi:uncharacterized membrane protein
MGGMMKLYEHKPHQHKIRNVNKEHNEQMSFGERVADSVASGMGSWRFVIIQTIIVCIWIAGNVWILAHPFDAWPFILLNLVFSTQAAYASPLILMAQNRQSAKDRLTAEEDYNINRKGEHEIEQMIAHLDKQDETILQIVKEQAKHTELLLQLHQRKRT